MVPYGNFGNCPFLVPKFSKITKMVLVMFCYQTDPFILLLPKTLTHQAQIPTTAHQYTSPHNPFIIKTPNRFKKSHPQSTPSLTHLHPHLKLLPLTYSTLLTSTSTSHTLFPPPNTTFQTFLIKLKTLQATTTCQITIFPPKAIEWLGSSQLIQ